MTFHSEKFNKAQALAHLCQEEKSSGGSVRNACVCGFQGGPCARGGGHVHLYWQQRQQLQQHLAEPLIVFPALDPCTDTKRDNADSSQFLTDTQSFCSI